MIQSKTRRLAGGLEGGAQALDRYVKFGAAADDQILVDLDLIFH